MTKEYKLCGLSKSNSATIELPDSEETFNVPVDMPQDRFDALFSYCKFHWDEEKIAIVSHDGINDNNLPINPKVIEIKIHKK